MRASWDFFDTLVGRRIGTGRRLIESLGNASFVERRYAAERKFQSQNIPYSLEDIYREMGEDPNREWQAELANVFPIKRYAQKLGLDDFIVSDMYLSEAQLREILAKVGISFAGQIFVTPNGKHTGRIWKQVLGVSRISTHTGDNMYSDIQKPRNYSIRTKLADTSFSRQEQIYAKFSEDLAYWVRRHRLENIVDERVEKLNTLQIEFNMPFLWAASHVLASYTKENSIKKLLFMSRDGCIFQQVFSKLYPDIPNEYLYISRECLITGSDSYFEYLNSKLDKDASLVDLSASGGSLKAALPKLKVSNPRIWTPLYLISPWNVELGPIQLAYITTNAKTTINNTFIEMLNYAEHWHVADIVDGEPVFDQEGEYNMDLVEGYHRIANRMILDMPAYDSNIPYNKIIEYCLGSIHREGEFIRRLFPGHHIFEARRKKSAAFGATMPKEEATGKVVVVGAVRNYRFRDIEPWYKSLRASGFTGQIHMLCYGLDMTTLKALEDHGIHTHLCSLDNEQLVIRRFRDIANISKQFPDSTWIVFADVGDIVFQSNPEVYLDTIPEDKSILVSSEGVLFKSNKWAKENLERSFPDKPELMDEFIYNAGSIAVRAETMRRFGRDIYNMCKERPQARAHDQAAMNLLIRDSYRKDTIFEDPLDGWCYNGASSAFAKPEDRAGYLFQIPLIDKEGKCYLEDQKMPVLFHHYARDPVLARRVRSWVSVAYDKIAKNKQTNQSTRQVLQGDFT